MNMDKRTQTGFLIALIAILLACCVISESHSTLKTKRESFVFKIMGTVASFTFEDYDTNSFRKDCISARKQFDRILNVANLYDKNSELVRLNNSAYEKDFICYPFADGDSRMRRSFTGPGRKWDCPGRRHA